MTLIEHVYDKHFSAEHWKNTGEFKTKDELIAYITFGYCPSYFIKNYPSFKPCNKSNGCAIADRSERYQKKVCTYCWNREYIKANNSEYELYLELKAKYESEKTNENI